MEHPNATWNDFSTNIIQKGVFFQASSKFLSHEEEIKTEMTTLGQMTKFL